MRHFLIAVLAFGIGFAVAQQRPRAQEPGQFGGGRGRGGFPSIGFGLLDTDSDGTVSAAELNAAPRALAKLDQDSDGRITQEEARPAIPQGRGGKGREGGRGGRESGADTGAANEMVQTLMAFDANSDGKLAKSELPERMQGIFDRGDADKDGFLSASEVRNVAGAQAQPSAEQGGRGPRGRGGDINFLRMDPVLAVIDANADSVLSAEELRNASSALQRLDKNGDGRLTRAEAMPAVEPESQF